MNIRDMVKENRVQFPADRQIKADEYAMQKWIDKLDSLLVEYEARWGVGVLENLVSPATKEKWDRQLHKIADAIKNSDIFVMPDLFAGTQRGYAALESEAMAAGHKPHGAPVCWTVLMPCGKELAICATRHDAAVLHGNCRDEFPLEIWTLQEVANFIEANSPLSIKGYGK